MFENVCLVFGQLSGNFRKSSENRQNIAINMYKIIQTKRRLKTASTNKLTPLSPPQYPKIFGVTIITLLTCNLFLLNSLNLIVAVYVKQEKHTSSKGVKSLNLVILIRKLKLSTFLYYLSMFRLFVLFIASHYYRL